MEAKKELFDRIRRLKAEKRALILCHNYQRVEIQEVSDHIGDSLELCMAATQAEGFEEIVFCGVGFMAETAAVLNPSKKVLIPARSAICDMAWMLTGEQVRQAKAEHPEAAVVLYVNSLAEAKAEADVICTSANAVKVVSRLDEEEVLFGPDRNLGLYVAKNVPEKRIIPLPPDGGCYVHKMIRPQDVITARDEHPNAEVLIHPECDPEVLDLADFVVSTGGMVKRARESKATEFVIGTEATMAETLARRFPSKRFYPILPDALCRGMKNIDLRKLVHSLEKDVHVVTVDPGISQAVRAATQRMLDMTR